MYETGQIQCNKQYGTVHLLLMRKAVLELSTGISNHSIILDITVSVNNLLIDHPAQMDMLICTSDLDRFS